MPPTLSIAIPVYNFGQFIPETLQSILRQEEARRVEIVILDGASTDDTAGVVAGFQKAYPNIRYVRRAARGGIDRDMAASVECSTGDYCWLFSGDDLMHADALARALAQIKSGHDLYLCKHMELCGAPPNWSEWPTLNIAQDRPFELSDKNDRLNYFSLALTSEAFFSFMGGLIVKRAAWNRATLNEEFVGSCWAHAARMFELMPGGLAVKCLAAPYLDRRPGNDSFIGKGLVNRLRIAIEGYHQIADRFFGHESVEAYHIRRVIRRESPLLLLLRGKLCCRLNPGLESRVMMDRLVSMAYCDPSFESLRTRLLYKLSSPARLERTLADFRDGYLRDFGLKDPAMQEAAAEP